jgi:hypothetical protein
VTGRSLAIAALVLLATAAPPAVASRTQESTFQDDNHLIYATDDVVAHTMDRMKALGADRLRITIEWTAVAPALGAANKPAGFDGADPGAYPAGVWDNYDRVVQMASDRGLGLNFNITVPGPLWAMGPSPRDDIANRFAPSPAEFGDFVRAVARRYPQVDYWTIQNEPNQPGWLDPQWVRAGRRWVESSPSVYRGLVDAAWSALQDTGHGGDTILIGETAPKGVSLKGTTRAISPGRFIKRLYCLDDHLQMLRGRSATARGCPASPSPSVFRATHPGLFDATGYAHHPYELIFAPNRPPRHSDWYTIANLPKLSALLRRVRARFGAAGGMPLYLTEFGYQTHPPDPLGVSPATQARYLNQAEYLAYRSRSVRTLAQFLLYDDGPPFALTFQSGLEYADGTPKPAQAAYRFPLFLPSPAVRRGGRLHVWGLLRAAPNGQAHRVDVLFRALGARRYHRIARVRTQAARGYVDARVRVRRSGVIRLRWGAVSSRAAAFRVP